jgi:iron complex outermembrane receptor protein
LYYDKYDNSLFSYDDDTYTTQNKRSAFKSWYNDDTIGGSMEAGIILWDNHDLKAAFHYKRDRHNEHDEGEPERNFKDEYYSIGIEDTVTLSDRWSLLAGMSYDWQFARDAEDYDSDTGTISDFDTQDATAFNPQVGVFFDFSEFTAVYATIACKSRLPSLKDRYSYRMGYALPNTGLDPEIAVNYEVGFEMTSQRVDFEGAAFFSDVDDYIQSVTIPDPDDPTSTLSQNQNIGRVSIYGAEAQLTFRLTDALVSGLNYTFTKWDNRSNSEKITDIPEHKVVAYAHYTMWEILRLTVCAEHYAERYCSSDGVRETDSYTIADVKAACKLFMGLNLEAGVDNVFDEDYEIDEGYPERGASYFANLTYRY